MSKSEHQHAINAALATSDKLLDLFAALGSKQDQMRGLWAAFGLARRNLYGKLDDTRHVNRTLAQLRETSRAMLEKQILAAAQAEAAGYALELWLADRGWDDERIGKLLASEKFMAKRALLAAAVEGAQQGGGVGG